MENKELLIVTGATGGLGKAISMYFASMAVADKGLFPILVCRSREKAEDLREYVEPLGLSREDYDIFLADISDSSSVDSLVERIKALQAPVRALVNNAGSMFGEHRMNAEGIEMNMAVNFYGPARLAEQLAPLCAKEASIVNVLSVTRKWVKLEENFMKGDPEKYTRLGYYSRSKLALSIFTADMAERYPDIYVNGVDPGVMNTKMLKMDRWFDRLADIVFRPFTLQPYQSLEGVSAACENEDGVRGHVFTRKKHFPIEKNISGHPLRKMIRSTICNSIK